MTILRVFGAYLAAVLVLIVLAVITQSLFVLSALTAVGAEIGAGDALAMLGDDLIGLGPLYGIFIALGLAVALLAAALVSRLLPVPRGWVFSAAGVVCMLVMLTLMKEVFFGVQIIAGARSMTGLLVQAVAGGIAGVVFVLLTPQGGLSKSRT
tara:strand:- start:2 stop:460 length:459 start_codon:yes stop_codon:yes gene_type:complete